MALPKRDRAANWVGQTVIDRDGTEIGSCTAVFADDATGLPEWICVGFEGRSVVIPVVDAAERGGRVQVAVGRADVVSAPSVDDTEHVSGDQEVALYRHYGIEYSRAASDTLLPASEASSTGAESDSKPSTTASAGAESDETPSAQRRRRLAAGAAALAALVTIAATVIRLRRRPSRRPPKQRRPAAAEEAARRAHTASVHIRLRAGHLAAVTAPLLATVGRVSLAGARTGALAARQAAHGATRFTEAAASRTAGRAGEVGRASVQVGRRVGGAVESVPEAILEGGHRIQRMWKRGMGMLSVGLGFAAGYVLGTRAGRERFEQIKQAANTVAERPEVQQALQRVKAAAAPSQENGSDGAPQSTVSVTARLRRRRPATDPVIAADTSLSPSSDADMAVGLLAEPATEQDPPAMPPQASDHPGDPLR
jgi:hypothetical protein